MDPIKASDTTPSLPFRAEYDLTRRQRAMAHLFVWKPYILIPLGLFVGVPVLILSLDFPWGPLLALGPLFLAKPFLLGCLEIIIHRRLHLSIVFNESPRFPNSPALGVGAKEPEKWMFLDSILFFGKSSKDAWTIYQYDGVVVSIPVDVLPDAILDLIRQQMRRSRTPEGHQIIMERGRIVESLEKGGLIDENESE